MHDMHDGISFDKILPKSQNPSCFKRDFGRGILGQELTENNLRK
jgi:hypothetical protein